MADSRLIIHVNIKGFDDDSFMDDIKDHVDGGMEKLAEEIEWAWRTKAGQSLNKSKDKYLKGLTVENNDGNIEVTLTGWVPVAIESGAPGFDLHEGFLKGAMSRVIPLEKETGHPIFRTISIGSPGWLHPGIEARPIYDEIENDMPDIIDEAFKDIFK